MLNVRSVNSFESPTLLLSLHLANAIDANGHASGGVYYKQRGGRALGPPLATTFSNKTIRFERTESCRSNSILQISDVE